MDAITLAGLVVYSTGAFLFAASLVLWVEQRLDARRANLPRVLAVPVIGSAADVVNVVLSVVSVVWFAANALLLAAPEGARWAWWLGLGYVGVAFLYPPLIMHAVTCDEPGWAKAGPAWRWAPRLAWVASLTCTVVSVGGFLGWLSIPAAVLRATPVALGLLFLAASVFAIAAMRRFSARPEPAHLSRARRSQGIAFGFMALVFLVIVFGGFEADDSQRVLRIVAHSLPLLFFAVGTYHDSRVEFVDLLVKRGTAFAVSLVVLMLFFAAVEPWLDQQALGPARTWFYALALVPLVLALPWLQARLERYIDRAWLRRQHTPLGASRVFLAAIESAPDEHALRERAEATLSRLFDTEVQLVASDHAASHRDSGSACGLDARAGDVEIRLAGAASHLVLCAARRESGVPLLSEDVTLLSLLGELFAVMLAQTRLQSERRAHDQQARELALQASRSELKALRAQINPHFLFNALNTIGGLIRRDPEEADRMVERLAEVFRYTLTRSEAEWVRVDEELNFVRAYLDVERARFGDRLQVNVAIDPPAASCMVPTMVVQTLVENAIKHGVAQARGPAAVRVDAAVASRRLEVRVINSGPVTSARPAPDRPAASVPASVSAPTPAAGMGHGLANIRARLAGYFGDAASLTLEQRPEVGETRVHLRLPAVNVPPVAVPALRESVS